MNDEESNGVVKLNQNELFPWYRFILYGYHLRSSEWNLKLNCLRYSLQINVIRGGN